MVVEPCFCLYPTTSARTCSPSICEGLSDNSIFKCEADIVSTALIRVFKITTVFVKGT